MKLNAAEKGGRIFCLKSLLTLLFLASLNLLWGQPPIQTGDCSRTALYFNSTTNISPTISALSETTQGSGTWEAWVKKVYWAGYNSDEKLFMNDFDYPAENCFYVSLHGNVGFHFRTGNTGGAYVATNGTFAFAANSWHHFAVTWSESGGIVTTTIFVDGVTQGSTTSTSTFDLGSTFHIGGKDGSYKLQGGEMAEVRVWDVARTEQEIFDNMNTALTGSETGLVGYWPLDEPAGSLTATNLVTGGGAQTVNNLTAATDWKDLPLSLENSQGVIYNNGSHAFGDNPAGTTLSETFTINNVTATDVNLDGSPAIVLTGTDADQFSLDLTSTASTVSGNDLTTFVVNFTPTTLGAKSAAVTVTNVASCSDPFTLNLSGTSISPSLAYGGVGFSENTANDGSVTGSITVTLTGDTFQDDDTDNLLDIGTEVSLGNIPSGLIPVMTLNSSTEAILTLTGNATSHNNTDEVANITFEFDDAAFTNFAAANITDATGPANTNLGIKFTKNPSVIYTGDGFTEITSNNGSVTGTMHLALGGDTFQDDDADGLLDVGSEVTIANAPAGLTPKFSIRNNTLAGKEWTQVPVYENSDWTSITYGNGLFVAIAYHGLNQLMTSPDGITWTPRKVPVANWNSICFGNGIFVAVGDEGKVMSSSDGITWTERPSVNDNNWNAVTYGNGLFVAVASTSGTNEVMTSPDGITWTAQTSALLAYWTSITYGNGLFVAVGYSDYVMTSSDGISWTLRTALTGSAWASVTYGNGIFVAVDIGGNELLTSTDGINWTLRTAPRGLNFKSIAYGNGLFVAVHSDEISYIIVSSDGITWEEISISEVVDWEDITYADGLFVAISQQTSNVIVSGSVVDLTFDGVADSHQDSHDISSLQFAFANSAFANTAAVDVVNATGPAESGIAVDFNDNSAYISFGGAGFTEEAANDGTVSGSITMTLSGDTFQDTNADNLLDIDTEVSFAGIPDGLTPTVTLSSSTEAVLTLSGHAHHHQVEHGIDNITIVFQDAAFTTSLAAAVANGTGPASTGNGISFLDNSVGLTYSSESFQESSINDGSITGSVTIILTGDTFNDPETDNMLNEGSQVVFSNVPMGLAPVVTLSSSTSAVITLSGNAVEHQRTHSLDDMTWVFTDAAFSATSAATVINAYSQNTAIDFENNPFVSYAGAGFAETGTNDGAVSGDLTISLTGALFQDSDLDNLLDVGSELVIDGLPDGLEPTLTINENKVSAIEWVSHSAPAASWKALAYGNDRFVAVANNGAGRLVMSSADGKEWNEVAALAKECWWEDITYGNGRFVAVGTNCVMTSADGISWAQVDTPVSENWKAVTYANGLYVAAASSGTQRVITSQDGINWTAQDVTNIGGSPTSIVYGNGLYVVAWKSFSAGNKIVTSPDGITWTFRDTGGGKQISDVTFGNGLFVAVTQSAAVGGLAEDRVLTSPDGITWTPSAATSASSWRSVTFGDGKFVAVASGGSVMYSADGTNWTAATGAEGNIWRSVVYGDGRFVAVASDGTNQVMTSEASASATLSLSGNADLHQDADDVADITFEFDDSAFSGIQAVDVLQATEANSGVGIDFEDNGVAPVISPVSNQSVNALDALVFTISATDSDAPAQTLIYELGRASTDLGMSIDPASGEFSWTPDISEVGNTYFVDVIVSDPYLSSAVFFEIIVEKATQEITFNALANKTFGDAAFDLTATGGASGNAVTYVSSDETVATVSGSTVTIVGAGTTTIMASQAGDANYHAATDVDQNFVVGQASLSATADDKAISKGESLPAFTITYSGFVNGDDPSVIDTEPIASTVADSSSPAGTYDITLEGGSDDNYAFMYSSGTLTIEEVLGLIGRSAINVYPNPTSDRLYIDSKPHRMKSMRLLNLGGKTLIEESASTQMDISHLVSGIYILQIDDLDGKSTSHRIIKR